MEQMPDAPKCLRCGAPIAADAPDALCPKCLLALSLSAPTEAYGGDDANPEGTRVVEPKPPPAISEIAPHFPQLEILECLGRGGMGVVYKARQPKLNRLVALKILAREREQDPRFAERFLREAQALARLNHPNIVTVYDFGEAGGLYYLLMEFVDGMNLRELLRARPMLPAEALTIVPRICEALQYAHEQGIVHRDIKPENILLDKQGRVKIADFGIAKILGEQQPEVPLTGAQQTIGTPHYMAPEQVEKPASVDHRADIYSLGVVFYEMLTGELPLGKFAAPSTKVQVDVRLDEVVLHALEKEPDRRYQQVSQVKSDVETIATTPPKIIPKPKGAPPPQIGASMSAPESGKEFISGKSPVGITFSPTRVISFVAVGLLLAGLLGTPLLLAVSARDELVFVFGGLALFLALIFGIIGWRDRLGRSVAIAMMALMAFIVVAAIPFGLWVSHSRARTSQGVSDEAQMRANQLREAALKRAATQYLTAPATRGEITRMVTATGALLSLTNEPGKWRITGLVAEADIAAVKTGQAVRFTMDAFPDRTFDGDVIEVSNIPTRVENLVGYSTTIDATDADEGFRPGMTANVSIFTAHRDDVLEIPNAALRFRLPNDAAANRTGPGKRVVQTLREPKSNRPVRTEIATGITDGVYTEVVSGLNEGDLVIVSMTGATVQNQQTSEMELTNTRYPARTNLGAIQAQNQSLRIQLRQAQTQLAHVRQLADQKFVPMADVQSAQDKVDELQARVDGDEAGVARVRVRSAQREVERLTGLYNSRLVSAADFEEAKARLEIGQAELKALETDAQARTTALSPDEWNARLDAA